MREIRPSGSEGGARLIPRPYPYFSAVPVGLFSVVAVGLDRTSRLAFTAFHFWRLFCICRARTSGLDDPHSEAY